LDPRNREMVDDLYIVTVRRCRSVCLILLFILSQVQCADERAA